MLSPTAPIGKDSGVGISGNTLGTSSKGGGGASGKIVWPKPALASASDANLVKFISVSLNDLSTDFLIWPKAL